MLQLIVGSFAFSKTSGSFIIIIDGICQKFSLFYLIISKILSRLPSIEIVLYVLGGAGSENEGNAGRTRGQVQRSVLTELCLAWGKKRFYIEGSSTVVNSNEDFKQFKLK